MGLRRIVQPVKIALEELESARAAEEAAQDANATARLSSTGTDSKRGCRPARKLLPEDLPQGGVTLTVSC
jgi:hypothetical protein